MTSPFLKLLGSVFLRAFLVAGSALHFGCSAGPPSISSERPAPSSKEPRPSAVLLWLWTKDAQGGDSIQSVWVEDTSEGPIERGRRREAVAADASGIWALRVSARTFSCKACECEESNSGACSHVSISSKELKAVRLPEGKEISILGSEPSCGDEALQQGEGNVELVSMVGPWIGVAKSSMLMACGAAHPMFGGEWLIYHLGQRKFVKMGPSSEDDKRLSKQAHDILVRTGQGCISSDEAPATLSASSFRYDRKGKLRGHYLYGMPSNYACGTGPDHYSMVTELVDDALAQPLQSLSQAPPWMLGYLQKAEGELRGVQEISDTWDYSAYLRAFLQE